MVRDQGALKVGESETVRPNLPGMAHFFIAALLFRDILGSTRLLGNSLRMCFTLFHSKAKELSV